MAVRVASTLRRRVRQELERKAPTLKQLSAAFAPTFVLPEDRRQAATARSIRETARAVRQVSQQRGISFQEAGRQLRQVRGEVTARGRVLRRARREGLSKLQTLAGLRQAGVRPELVEIRRSEFVTPEGRFGVTGLPGGQLRTRQVRPGPRRRPTPRATPRR